MTDAEREIQIEQSHVDKAYARLEELRERASDRRAAEQLNRSGNTPQSVFERDVAVHHLVTWSSSLDAGVEGLVFGRLDMTAGDVYRIGRLGLRTEDYEPLVLDWRAPASAPFYRATPADNRGVARRRTIRLQGRKVVDLEDDLLDATADAGLALVGDGALMSAVTRAKSDHMRDIVQTIQHEQDEIIRAPDRGVLLVTGGPGTGKTAVALHRVAYLLYGSRERYIRGGVLVVGPSPRFMDYVSKVLPSLGEDSTVLRSLEDFVPGVAVSGSDGSVAARAKGSVRMTRLLDRLIASIVRTPPKGIRLRYEGHHLHAGPVDLERIKQSLLRRGKPFNELGMPARMELARALLDDPDHHAITELLDEKRFEEAASQWWPALDAVELFNSLAAGETATSLAELGAGLFDDAELDVVAASWGSSAVSHNDVALIDELTARLGPAPQDTTPDEPEDDLYPEVTTFAERTARRRRPLREANVDHFAHVVVDEAQDMSPMQWRMVWRRGRAATWTVVGDWAQSAWPDPAESREAFAALVGRRGFQERHLDTNYRGASEIAELGDRLLARIDPDAVPPRAVRSSGHVPRLLASSPDLWAGVTDAVAELDEEIEGTPAVIVPMGRLDEAAIALAGSRAQVLSSIEAKGLEFDGAVVVNPSEMVDEHDAGMRLLYVAVTRAAHVLCIVGDQDESRLFGGLARASGPPGT